MDFSIIYQEFRSKSFTLRDGREVVFFYSTLATPEFIRFSLSLDREHKIIKYVPVSGTPYKIQRQAILEADRLERTIIKSCLNNLVASCSTYNELLECWTNVVNDSMANGHLFLALLEDQICENIQHPEDISHLI